MEFCSWQVAPKWRRSRVRPTGRLAWYLYSDVAKCHARRDPCCPAPDVDLPKRPGDYVPRELISGQKESITKCKNNPSGFLQTFVPTDMFNWVLHGDWRSGMLGSGGRRWCLPGPIEPTFRWWGLELRKPGSASCNLHFLRDHDRSSNSISTGQQWPRARRAALSNKVSTKKKHSARSERWRGVERRRFGP